MNLINFSLGILYNLLKLMPLGKKIGIANMQYLIPFTVTLTFFKGNFIFVVSLIFVVL